jgi:hypothetical protein
MLIRAFDSQCHGRNEQVEVEAAASRTEDARSAAENLLRAWDAAFVRGPGNHQRHVFDTCFSLFAIYLLLFAIYLLLFAIYLLIAKSAFDARAAAKHLLRAWNTSFVRVPGTSNVPEPATGFLFMINTR